MRKLLSLAVILLTAAGPAWGQDFQQAARSYCTPTRASQLRPVAQSCQDCSTPSRQTAQTPPGGVLSSGRDATQYQLDLLTETVRGLDARIDGQERVMHSMANAVGRLDDSYSRQFAALGREIGQVRSEVASLNQWRSNTDAIIAGLGRRSEPAVPIQYLPASPREEVLGHDLPPETFVNQRRAFRPGEANPYAAAVPVSNRLPSGKILYRDEGGNVYEYVASRGAWVVMK